MRHSGKFSFLVSLGIHGMLVGAVLLCIGEKNSTPPRIHLVYGEVGVENSGGIIAKTGEENAPAIQMEPVAQSNDSTEALDAQLMGESASALPNAGSQLATPLLLTAD